MTAYGFGHKSPGEVAEQVDAMVSKTIGINSRVGSSPTLPINRKGQMLITNTWPFFLASIMVAM